MKIIPIKFCGLKIITYLCIVFRSELAAKDTKIGANTQILTVKQKKMNTYHAVAMTIGPRRCSTRYMGEIQAETKPESTVKSTGTTDYYMDYFDTKEDAERFVADNAIG